MRSVRCNKTHVTFSESTTTVRPRLVAEWPEVVLHCVVCCVQTAAPSPAASCWLWLAYKRVTDGVTELAVVLRLRGNGNTFVSERAG